MSDCISLIDFWRYRLKKQGKTAIVRPCHEFKAKALTDLVLGKLPTPNLMILEPPRIGKTDLGVKSFVPWAGSYFPDSEWILGGYNQDLSKESLADIRNTFGSVWYRRMIGSDWGVRMRMRGDKIVGEADNFRTLDDGCYKAVGRGGGATGYGAGKTRPEFGGSVVIDDPLKAQENNSNAAMKESNRWIEETLQSRRNRLKDPMTPMVLIMQRLHPNDPAGYLLKTQRHRWTVIQIPAHNEKWESIWDEKISIEELRHMKDYNPDLYYSQYMQAPSEDGFIIFRPEWWNLWDNQAEVEKRITYKFITADTAFKAKDSSDYSVFQCWGCEGTRGLYLMDQARGKWEFPELLKQATAFKNKHTAKRMGFTPASEFFIEDKASGTSLVQSLRKNGINAREWLPSKKTSSDKVGRAKDCTQSIHAGRVFLPDPGLQEYRWVDIFVSEHTAFTSDDSHVNDDQVDGTTMAISIWQEKGGGTGPLPEWGGKIRKLKNVNAQIYTLQ